MYHSVKLTDHTKRNNAIVLPVIVGVLIRKWEKKYQKPGNMLLTEKSIVVWIFVL